MGQLRTTTRVPAGPALVRRGVAGIAFGAGLGAFACGTRTDLSAVPAATGMPTPTPDLDAGRDGGLDARSGDAGVDATISFTIDSGGDATFTMVDSGFDTGVFDATGRNAADALADAASDGHIMEPPCGKKAPPRR